MKATVKVAVFGAAVIFVAGIGLASENRSQLLLSDAEIEQIISHGPWPPDQRIDESNRVSGN